MSAAGRNISKAFGLCLVSILAASACQAGTIGQNRCIALGSQLTTITRTTEVAAPDAVNDLAEKARTLCSTGRTAQGLRTYAKAIQLMGSQPALPSEDQSTNPNQRIKS